MWEHSPCKNHKPVKGVEEGVSFRGGGLPALQRLGIIFPMFAQLLGVSKKTVEAWEAGTKKPNGSVLRLFQVIERDLSLVEALAFRSEAG